MSNSKRIFEKFINERLIYFIKDPKIQKSIEKYHKNIETEINTIKEKLYNLLKD